jgi:hypothetical protein
VQGLVDRQRDAQVGGVPGQAAPEQLLDLGDA